LFNSVNEGKNISLDEYLEKSKPHPNPLLKGEGTEQKDIPKEIKTIYYIIAKSKAEALASPYLAQFKEKNIDVLMLTDPIDSFLVQ